MALKSIRKPRNPVQVGERFGRLLVTHHAGSDGRNAIFKCLCDCGATSVLPGARLRFGNTTSCGCYRREIEVIAGVTHGLSRAPEYRIWWDMKRRCRDPRQIGFKNYGGRGITVCDRWNDFANFYQDMGPRPTPKHSIERKNNDRGYTPENCTWATHKEQANNTRRNRYVVFNGKRMTLTQAIALSGVKEATVKRRIRAKWPERSWFKPVKPAA